MKFRKSSIEFRALAIFSVVAESESLTKAGEVLGITQSAVSQAIKQLEDQTGAHLVLRRGRPIKLTPSGRILYEHASQLLADGQRMLTDIQLASDRGLTELSIGMIDSLGSVISQQFVRSLKPLAAKVMLRTGVAAPLSAALVKREVDVLITSDPMHGHPEFACFPILRDPFLIVAPAGIIPAGEHSHSWLAKNTPFVHYSRETRIGMLTDLIARRLEIKLSTHYEFDSTETLLRFVQAGYGWSIVTGLCLAHYPPLLEGVQVLPLVNGANARVISLLCYQQELGGLPFTVAQICRDICEQDLLPTLRLIAPWLDKQCYLLSEVPLL